jgi:small subunit ribosomal protein S1
MSEHASNRSLSDDLDEKLQQEIEAALGDMSLEDMVDMTETPPARGRGEPDRPHVKVGVVFRIHRNDVLVEFGPKSQGVCAITDFDDPPTIGERYDFVVDRYDAKEGLLLLSRQGAVRKADWASLDLGQHVEAMCVGTNKGGLDMEVAKKRAFMPAGQVDIGHIDDLSKFVGEKIACEVIELDRQRGRIVLSRRRVLEAERAEQRDKILEELKVGDQVQATVRTLMPYGAFADLGGVDGLIHISDISHERIKHPSDKLVEGQQLTVQVMKIDTTQDPPRIGLGLKQCQSDPYQSQTAEIAAGATVSGRVTRIMPYGAFVELSPGVEGLVHISQLAEGRVNRVGSVVKIDEVITVKVLDIDRQTRRISLSLRATTQQQEEDSMRPLDPALKKLRARFSDSNLKGGIG